MTNPAYSDARRPSKIVIRRDGWIYRLAVMSAEDPAQLNTPGGIFGRAAFTCLCYFIPACLTVVIASGFAILAGNILFRMMHGLDASMPAGLGITPWAAGGLVALVLAIAGWKVAKRMVRVACDRFEVA